MQYWGRRAANWFQGASRGRGHRGVYCPDGSTGGLFFVLVVGLLLWGARTTALHAQGGPDEVVRPAGTVVNLFQSLDPSSPIHGVRVEYPSAWRVTAVRLLRYGTEPVPLDTTMGPEPGTVHATPARSVRGPHELLLRVRLPEQARTDQWRVHTLVPSSPAADSAARAPSRIVGRRQQTVRGEPSLPTGPNKALTLDAAVEPVLLESNLVPPLGQRHAFTLEFWVRTSGLDEVVLSTWTGDEAVAYPVEVIVDRGGRLRYYNGQPGRHRALRSQRPVADGQWHHAAVIYDAAAKRTRLVVDGKVADAMSGRLASASSPVEFALGGRVGHDPTAHQAPSLFSGELDELRIWAHPRSVEAVQAGTGQPIRAARSDATPAVRIGFDADAPKLLRRWPDGARRTPTTLSFRSSLRSLRAHSEDRSVTLHWVAGRASVDAFVVERSTDGTHFTDVATLAPTDVQDSTRTDATEYTYTDANVPGNVVYYRIRQRRPDGRERTSGIIKMGLGQGEKSAAPVTLIGNFPNPFTETTTVAYEVREAQPITITVWDVTGKRITQLAEGLKQPGYHETTFEAKGLTSGTYFVRLTSRNRTQSHRMVVLK